MQNKSKVYVTHYQIIVHSVKKKKGMHWCVFSACLLNSLRNEPQRHLFIFRREGCENVIFAFTKCKEVTLLLLLGCVWFCNPKDRSTPHFPVLHHLPELAQTHVHWMPSNHLLLCCSLLLPPSIFPSIRVFSMSRLFTSGGQSTIASASASVLPMNIQDWFP